MKFRSIMPETKEITKTFLTGKLSATLVIPIEIETFKEYQARNEEFGIHESEIDVKKYLDLQRLENKYAETVGAKQKSFRAHVQPYMKKKL